MLLFPQTTKMGIMLNISASSEPSEIKVHLMTLHPSSQYMRVSLEYLSKGKCRDSSVTGGLRRTLILVSKLKDCNIVLHECIMNNSDVGKARKNVVKQDFHTLEVCELNC